jgi:hypothetical protein
MSNMSTITLDLPDALIESLKAHDVQDISTFAVGAMWRELEDMDDEHDEQGEPQESGESEAEFQHRVQAIREGLEAYERGDWIDGDAWIAKRRAEMAERKRQREAA